MSPSGPLMLLQAAAPGGWTGPVIALSLVAIAGAAVVMAVILALWARQTAHTAQTLEEEVGRLRQELGPVVESVRETAEQTRALVGKVDREVGEVIRTSEYVRHEVRRGMRKARRRMSDLDALAEVMQGELEETALDVAATLRTVRRGKGVIGRIRRLLRR